MLCDGKTRLCGFCKQPVQMTKDDADERQYSCAPCAAVETISKSRTSWWYHGWKRQSGEKLRAPTVAEMDRGKYDWQPDI